MIKTPPPPLPRVLIDANRHAALEIARGRLYSHVINPQRSPISIERVPLADLPRTWNELGSDMSHVRKFASVWGKSFCVKTSRVERILQELLMNTIDVKTASTAELVAFYNRAMPLDKQVKKFADRATAEKRVTALISGAKPAISEMAKTDPDSASDPNEDNITKEKAMKTKSKQAADAKAKEVIDIVTKQRAKAKAKPEKKTKAKKPAASAEHASRAEAISASWNNKKVAAARSVKNNVKVGGVVYRSVLEAFKKLKLDQKKHGAFRLVLKSQGRAVFDGHTFTIVPKED